MEFLRTGPFALVALPAPPHDRVSAKEPRQAPPLVPAPVPAFRHAETLWRRGSGPPLPREACLANRRTKCSTRPVRLASAVPDTDLPELAHDRNRAPAPQSAQPPAPYSS